MKKKFITSLLLIILMQVVFIPAPNNVYAATSPSLGQAASFSVLAGLSMSAAAAGTVISGDLGLSPGLEVSRTGTWTVGGHEYFGTGGLSAGAQTDASSAYSNLAGQVSNGPWAASPWSPVPGVWTVASDTTFTGTITLNGSYDDVWVFQVGQDMTFSGSVVLEGNAQPCHVFWQIGRSATIASGSKFIGTLIASTGSVTLVSGASVNGRILVLKASLTTDGNTITGPACDTAPTSTPTPGPSPTSTPTSTPTPGPSPTSTPTPTFTPTPTPTSTPTPSLSSSAANSNFSSSPSAPVCFDFTPTNNPNLFQINRIGSRAVLYFTPVNDYLTYYYVAYGLSSGDERFGVSFPAGLSTGVVNFTINDLNPNTTYYFKVRGGNGCAPGGWSNNKESGSKNPSLPNTGMDPR